MVYTYVLKSQKDGKLHIGHSDNVAERLEEHNAGRVRSTKHCIPFVLLYQRNFPTRSEARWQERKWKMAFGHKQLAQVIDFIPR